MSHCVIVCSCNSILSLLLTRVWFEFSVFRKDELKLEPKTGKWWANLTRRKSEEISLLISNSYKNTKSRRVVKKGKTCSLTLAICKCVSESEFKGNSSAGRVRYVLLMAVFNLRIRERFLTVRATEIPSVFLISINKTTEKFHHFLKN